MNNLARVDNAGRDHNAAGEKLLRKLDDFGALLKDGLRCLVGSGNLVLRAVTEPKKLRALPSH
jgi:hypothetical protein